MRKKSARKKTPVRFALESQSALQPKVNDGLGAVQKAHRSHVADDIRSDFEDSLDLDEALRPEHSSSNRWDYLLGHGPHRRVVGLEPHSAADGEISVVIKKKESALEQLKPHLKTGQRVSRWFWVASGNVGFTAMERATRRLDEKGINFVGKSLLRKHLA